MKKDYLLADSEITMGAETEFVEKFWTENWRDRTVSQADFAHVAQLEEARLIEPYISSLKPEARILDGGCGLGHWTGYYASRGFDIVGMDLSRATVERLEKLFPELTFICGDIRRTGFPEGSFDAYLSWGTFEHFEIGLGPCFEEARRILKPGGYLFITVPFQNGRHLRRDGQELWHWDENYDREAGYRSSLRFYQWRLTLPELHRAFEMHGFRYLKGYPIHKEVGMRRMLKHEFGLSYESIGHRILRPLFRPVVPARYIAHMILGVGVRR